MNIVVFDFDYTLGDSTAGIAQSINYALDRLGHSAKDTDAIKKTIGLSLKRAYVELTGNGDPERAEQFANYFKEKADKVMLDNTVLYPDVVQMLEKLKENGYKTAIVTTKFRYRIEQILNKYNAGHLIDVIVGAEDVKVEKPDPEGLLWVIKFFGAEKDDVLFVGDSVVDAKTAERAGVSFSAVLTGTTSKEEFEAYPNVYIGECAQGVCQRMLP